MKINLLARKYFSITLNLLNLAPPFWLKNFQYFVAVDYHYFTDNIISYPTLEVDRLILDKQLEFISSNMNLINPKSFDHKAFFRSKPIKPSILITIDDADSSIKKNLDIFEKYNIPIIIFAPLGLCLAPSTYDGLRSRILRSFFEIKENQEEVEGDIKINFFEKIMSSSLEELEEIYIEINSKRNNKDIISSRTLLNFDELEELSHHPLITISSHSMSHPVLTQIPQKWLVWEITSSMQYLKKVNGDKKYFAYPYGYKGSINLEVKELLRKNGVKYAFSTRSKTVKNNSDSLELGRVGMLGFFNKYYFRGLVGGAFEIFDTLLGR